MIFLAAFLAYLFWINLITYRAFAADKQAAIDKASRTPEAQLLSYARKGGWIGAKIAQRRLRHKSHKQPFGSKLNIIGMVHAMSIVTVALVPSFLALAPTDAPLMPPHQTAAAAVSTPQHAGAAAAISLRPPAGRPATF